MAGAGVPENPSAWLMTTAKRRGIDHFRRADTLRRKITELGHARAGEEERCPTSTARSTTSRTTSCASIFLACHPVLSAESRAALTLRLVGGLTTAEIARGFLVTESTMGQRISRAKRTLSAAHAELELPTGADRLRRLDDVMAVIYLIFNEGYTATAGDAPTRTFEPGEFRLAGALDEDAFTPPPPARSGSLPGKNLPPAPARPARFNNFMPPPPLPPESPFDEFPATPGPDAEFSDDGEAEFSATPPPSRAAPAFAPPPPPQPFGGLPPAPALNFGGPPPGRPALPRPGGYLNPNTIPGLHMPPAPPAPSFDNGGGFGGGFPETVDFGRNSAPVIVRRSGPPGFIVLMTLIAGAAGGVWLGEKVTHNAVAALEASLATQGGKEAKAATPRKPPAPEVAPTPPQRK